LFFGNYGHRQESGDWRYKNFIKFKHEQQYLMTIGNDPKAFDSFC